MVDAEWDVTVCSYSNLLNHLLIQIKLQLDQRTRGARTWTEHAELAGWLLVMNGINLDPTRFLGHGGCVTVAVKVKGSSISH